MYASAATQPPWAAESGTVVAAMLRIAVGVALAPVGALHGVVLQAAPVGRHLLDVGLDEADLVAASVVGAYLERVEGAAADPCAAS